MNILESSRIFLSHCTTVIDDNEDDVEQTIEDDDDIIEIKIEEEDKFLNKVYNLFEENERILNIL